MSFIIVTQETRATRREGRRGWVGMKHMHAACVCVKIGIRTGSLDTVLNTVTARSQAHKHGSSPLFSKSRCIDSTGISVPLHPRSLLISLEIPSDVCFQEEKARAVETTRALGRRRLDADACRLLFCLITSTSAAIFFEASPPRRHNQSQSAG